MSTIFLSRFLAHRGLNSIIIVYNFDAITITFQVYLCAIKCYLFLKMPFSFALLVDLPVLTYVPVFWQMPVSAEDLISQSPSEAGTLKTLDPPPEFLIWSCDTIKLAHQIPGLVMALPSIYFLHGAK